MVPGRRIQPEHLQDLGVGGGLVALLLGGLGIGLAGTGLFLLKRAVLPATADEPDPAGTPWYWVPFAKFWEWDCNHWSPLDGWSFWDHWLF